MKKLLSNSFFQQAVTLLLSVIFIIIGALLCKYEPLQTTDAEFERAVVNEVIAVTEEPGFNNATVKTVVFNATILTGKEKGNSYNMTQLLDENSPPVPEIVEKGDKILVIYNEPEEENSTVSGWSYGGVNHLLGVILLVLSFFALILIIGRTKGISTIIALGITAAAVFLIFIPSVLTGRNIYASTIVVSLFVILSSLCLLNGWNKKTLCAVVGNSGGVLITGVLALFINKAFGITGILDSDYLFLTMLEGKISIDLPALIWGGILIGSLGAVMDVAMSIASAMHELSEQMFKPTFKKLIISGMNIGKDAIGTMTNTLILAYVGGSMATILLMTAYTRDIVLLLNYEMILVEVIQAIVGSIGILLAVPITVFFSAWIFLKSSKKENIDE